MDTPFILAFTALTVTAVVAYLVRLNQLLNTTPPEVQRLSPTRWTRETVLQTYKRLEENPITTKSYADKLPPKLERRYIVTGGSGLVGGYIVLQLLERGQPPESIRIVDFRPLNRPDMLQHDLISAVDFVQTDIASAESTPRAFGKQWPSTVAHWPLTVFHTAAIIIPADRSKLEYAVCESVNVKGTQHVVDAALRAGTDVLVSTTSGSISIRPVELWPSPWRVFWAWWSRSPENWRWPWGYWQVLDETDFFKRPRKHHEYYANYPASKAAAERIICGANSPSFRTGCIRPANGVYGNPTDNTVGVPLRMGDVPTWAKPIVQSFVHGINTAVAHLQFEAVLAAPAETTAQLPIQAGRPFVVTDPNPPISYGDLYFLLECLAATPFRTVDLQPVLILLLSHPIEWYTLIRLRFPSLGKILPPIRGDVKHLKPAIFSIIAHLVAFNGESGRPVAEGGLGYTGILTTLEGMAQEVLDWNFEHQDTTSGKKREYGTSLSLAEEIQRAAAAAKSP